MILILLNKFFNHRSFAQDKLEAFWNGIRQKIFGPLDSLIFVGKRQEEWRFEWENHRKTIGKWRFTLW